MTYYNINEYKNLVESLCRLPYETEYVEFKNSFFDKDDIGQYISALSNSATLLRMSHAYMIWGIDDKTHNIVGTEFRPKQKKIGGEELESWLLRKIQPKINFSFVEIEINNHHIVILEIQAALNIPVQFEYIEYIRIGSYKKKLREYPEKERELWRIFDKKSYESDYAIENIEGNDVINYLNYNTYFDLMKKPLPSSNTSILSSFNEEGFIKKLQTGKWSITNLGAILLAKDLIQFDSTKRKTVRIVIYKGKNKINTIKEIEVSSGYADGLQSIITCIMDNIETKEEIINSIRTNIPSLPEIAIRELVVNALIHQDFYEFGSGPLIEIFSDRIEISNPGNSIIPIDRLIDANPKSRNESLARVMRRFGICEERGSGIDKVILATEMNILPAPIFEQMEYSTRVILFYRKEFKDMDKNDRIRACYLHACLKYVEKNFMTNATLRKRFNIQDSNTAMASRIIKDTIEANLIRCYDDSVGNRSKKYCPFWA